MIEAEAFLEALQRHGFGPYLGVPCSFLTPLINAVIDDPGYRYLAASNEGEAVAIAAGAFLAGQRPVVMFQNSGLGNAFNPLTSLAYPFGLPLLLVTTQRGEPGLGDEPQHELMGAISEPLLRLARIGCALFPDHPALIAPRVARALSHLESTSLPFAFLMKKGALAQRPLRSQPVSGRSSCDLLEGDDPDAAPEIGRGRAVAEAADCLPDTAALIATTGRIGRELFAARERAGNLYVVGSMGCAASIALGVALFRPGRPVVVLDGDGAALMRLEALASVGHYRPANLVHVILDNGVHESTGGQATLAGSVRFDAIAAACGYATAVSRVSGGALRPELLRALATPGPHLIHLRVRPGSVPGLPRPDLSPGEIKARFMAFLAEQTGTAVRFHRDRGVQDSDRSPRWPRKM